MGDIAPNGRPPMATELYAAGRIIGNKCFDENHEFLKCKATNKNPSECMEAGTEVHKCVYGIYKEIGGKAPQQFKDFVACLDYNDFAVLPVQEVPGGV
eukprot:99567-Prymnesium_polylepis.1